MRKLLLILFFTTFLSLLLSETLFEVKDSSNNKVLDISTDGLRVMNGGDTLMVISTDGIRAYIQNDATKGLSRSFSVTTSASKGEKSQNKVFEIATDEGATFYNPTDNSDEIFSISKTGITANVNPGTGRDFEVNDQVSANKAGGGNLMKVSNKEVFETVNDSTMLWYKQKNAFRVGHVLINDPDSVGQASFASGGRNIASGSYSTAFGVMTEALTTASFTSGVRTIASGGWATAMGFESVASGNISFTAGDICTASGHKSVAMGYATTASGYASIATGQGTVASGTRAAAMGDGTKAQSYASLAVGQFNLDNGNSASWVETDPLFMVGNGTGNSSRSNAFTVRKDGNVGIGVAPDGNYRLSVLSNNFGIKSITSTTGTYSYGVFGQAGGATTMNAGIYGYTTASSGTRWAGFFNGDVRVTGTINPTKVDVKIDHPIDPENKYLSHSGVISDQMTSVYNGNVVLDGSGSAKVQLPEWFEAMNTDFKYQLTAIGAPGPNLYIAREISGNSFEISGGVANLKVSWMVTAVRNDNFARSNPVKIESNKKSDEVGYYLHPESFGLSEEKGMDYQVLKRQGIITEKLLK